MNGVLLNTYKSPHQTFLDEGLLFYPAIFEGEELAGLREACTYVLDQFLEDANGSAPKSRDTHISMRHLIDSRWHQGETKHLKTLLETIADPRCLGPVEQIFRGPSLFFTSSLFFNPSAGRTEGNWHRDLQFKLENEEAVKAHVAKREVGGVQFQIALVDNDDLEYVPYSPGRYDSLEEYYIRCADDRIHNREDGMPNALRLQQRAGDAVIFNPAGLHRGRYYADNPRLTFMLTYTPHQIRHCNYFTDQPWMLDREYLNGISPRATVFLEAFISAYQESWGQDTQVSSPVKRS